MLLSNDVVHYPAAPAMTLRILWIDQRRRLAYTYALGIIGALPRAVALDTLLADLAGNRAQLVAPAPCCTPDPALLPPQHLALRTRAWTLIRPLVEATPAIFIASSRSRLVAACCAAHQVSHPTIYRYLRRYWERGQHPDALLPDYANSGAGGQIRQARAGVKRGRPPASGRPGCNADAAMRATIAAAALRHRASAGPGAWRAAYRQMLADDYGGNAASAPSYGQFRYWAARLDTPAP